MVARNLSAVSRVTDGVLNISTRLVLVSSVTVGPDTWVQVMLDSVSPLSRTGQARTDVSVPSRTE